MRALVFGSMNIDYTYHVDHFVQPGETMSAVSQSVNPGGKGLNQAIALSRAGADAYMAGCVGAGGDMLIDILKESKVNTDNIRTCEDIQGNAVIQVSPTGENCILLFGGSNQVISDEQIEKTIQAFSEGDWLILQNEINNLPKIVESAHSQKMKIVLNPSPYNEKIDEVNLNLVDWLFLNEVEAKQLTKKNNPNDAWTDIHDRFPDTSVLITLGSKGSIAWQVSSGGVENAKQEAVKVDVIDTTGAGDTFTGYFVFALMSGDSLEDALKIATIASSIAVTREGAAVSIPNKDEVTSYENII